MAEFAINNKVHTATKTLPFMANYRKKLRMGGDIRRKGKGRECDGVCREDKED